MSNLINFVDAVFVVIDSQEDCADERRPREKSTDAVTGDGGNVSVRT